MIPHVSPTITHLLQGIAQAASLCLTDDDNAVALAAWTPALLIRVAAHLPYTTLLDCAQAAFSWWGECMTRVPNKAGKVLSAILATISDPVATAVLLGEENSGRLDGLIWIYQMILLCALEGALPIMDKDKDKTTTSPSSDSSQSKPTRALLTAVTSCAQAIGQAYPQRCSFFAAMSMGILSTHERRSRSLSKGDLSSVSHAALCQSLASSIAHSLTVNLDDGFVTLYTLAQRFRCGHFQSSNHGSGRRARTVSNGDVQKASSFVSLLVVVVEELAGTRGQARTSALPLVLGLTVPLLVELLDTCEEKRMVLPLSAVEASRTLIRHCAQTNTTGGTHQMIESTSTQPLPSVYPPTEVTALVQTVAGQALSARHVGTRLLLTFLGR